MMDAVKPEGYPSEKWEQDDADRRAWVVANWSWLRDEFPVQPVWTAAVVAESPSQDAAFEVLDPEAAPQVIAEPTLDVPVQGEGVTQVASVPEPVDLNLDAVQGDTRVADIEAPETEPAGPEELVAPGAALDLEVIADAMELDEILGPVVVDPEAETVDSPPTYIDATEPVTPLPAEQALQTWAQDVVPVPVRVAGAWQRDAFGRGYIRVELVDDDLAKTVARIVAFEANWEWSTFETPGGESGGTTQRLHDASALADTVLAEAGWVLQGGPLEDDMVELSMEDVPASPPTPALVRDYDPEGPTLWQADDAMRNADGEADTEEQVPELRPPYRIAPDPGWAFLPLTTSDGVRFAVEKADVRGWISGSREGRSDRGVGCIVFVDGAALAVCRAVYLDIEDDDEVQGFGVAETLEQVETMMGAWDREVA